MTWDALSSGHPPGHSPGPTWVKIFVEEVWQRVAQILGDSEWRGPCPRCDGELRIRGDETVLRGEWAERRLKSAAVRCSGDCTRTEAALALYHWLAMQHPQHPLVRRGRRPGTFLT